MPNNLLPYAAADAAIAGPIIYPLALGNDVGSIDAGESIEFSYGIAGVGFLSAAAADTPYQRGLANVLKEQINNSEQPGDQSFTNWWLRSQTDWSDGAGTTVMEPISDEKIQRSFYSSMGVDVWTPGQVSLLPSMKQKVALAAGTADGLESSLLKVESGYYVGFAEKVYYVLNDFSTSTALTGIGASEMVTGFCQGNSRAYLSTNVGVYGIETSTPTVANLLFTFPQTDMNARCFFAKDRLILTSKGAIWDEAPPSSGASSTTLAYSGALYRKSDDYAWVSVASSPSFILIAGASATESYVYSLTLTTPTSGLPVLNSPTVAAEFPTNERVEHMGAYLGAYLALATNLGIRIGTISNTGLTYGARLTAPKSHGPFAAFDRFLYYPTLDAGQTRTGVTRIDLSQIDATSRAAWASDVRVPATITGTCDNLTVDATGRVVLANVAIDKRSVDLYEAEDFLEPIGFLSTADIRLGTIEKKYFDSISVRFTTGWAGDVTVTSQTDGGAAFLVGTAGPISGDIIEYKINQPSAAGKIALGFTLVSTADRTEGPILESWQLRSLPSVNRQRLIKSPLLCFDHERDSRGVQYGYIGYALARYRALEEQSRGSWPFTYQDLQTGETYRVILEAISFNQVTAPTNASGFGGIIDLTMRVIGDANESGDVYASI